MHGDDDAINWYLDQEYPEDSSGYGKRTVQIPRNADHKKWAVILTEDVPKVVEKVAIVSANDTSDSGYGTVWDVDDDGTVEKIDEKDGYEGAEGRDVTGYIKEEYGLLSYASWEA